MTDKSKHIRKNLSDTRGNALGIGFFRIMMKCLGIKCCFALIWPIAILYAFFDKKAGKAANTYLNARFPDASKWKLKLHLGKMFAAQGQAIALAHWLRSGNTVHISEHNPEHLRKILLDKKNGVILLISHIGCWMAALTYMKMFNRNVNLLIQKNTNLHIAEMFKGDMFNIIDNSSQFGGLLDCLDAIQKGEIVCIMGDRTPYPDESSIEMELTNRKISIPESPWYLAAKTACPIVPMFTMMTKKPFGIIFHFADPILIPCDPKKKPSQDFFSPFIKNYAATLEKLSQEYPYQIFHYNTDQIQK